MHHSRRRCTVREPRRLPSAEVGTLRTRRKRTRIRTPVLSRRGPPRSRFRRHGRPRPDPVRRMQAPRPRHRPRPTLPENPLPHGRHRTDRPLGTTRLRNPGQHPRHARRQVPANPDLKNGPRRTSRYRITPNVHPQRTIERSLHPNGSGSELPSTNGLDTFSPSISSSPSNFNNLPS